MTAERVVRIQCDHRLGRRCSSSVVLDASTTEGARKVLRRAGWRRRFGPSSCGYDLCPQHDLEVPAETFPDWRK